MIAVLQTVLLRLHNKFAVELANLNQHWDDETAFEEARRLLIAVFQQVTYKYYVPNLIGMVYLLNLCVCNI